MEAIARFLAAHAIALLMLSVGLRTPSSIFKDISMRWNTLVRALAVVWLAVPLLALVIVYVLESRSIAAGTLLVMAICPGVPLVLGVSKRAQGDATTSLLVLISTAITALVLVPLWAVVLSSFTALELTFGMRAAAAAIIPNVLLPFALGRIASDASPRVARTLAKIAQALFVVGFGVLVVVVLARMLPALRLLTLRDIVAAALITLGAGLLGYLAAPRIAAQRVSLTYAAALGNPALALSVITLSYKQLTVVPFVLAFLLVRAVALVPFKLWFRRRAR